MKLIPKQRILPNGTKDEVRVTDNKLIKRTNKKMLQASNVLRMNTSYTNVDIADIDTDFCADAKRWVFIVDGMTYIEGKTEVEVSDIDNVNNIGNYYTNLKALWFIMPKGTTLEQAREQLAGLELIYQLARPKIYQSKFIY